MPTLVRGSSEISLLFNGRPAMKIRNFFLIVSLLGIFAQPSPPETKSIQAVTPTTSTTQEVWRTYTNTNQIHALTMQGGNLWAWTGGGVVRWDTSDGSSIKYTTADGLAPIGSPPSPTTFRGTYGSGQVALASANSTALIGPPTPLPTV